MWIFCCGAQRSGSTLQYNLVSEIVEIVGRGKRIEYFEAKDFDSVKEKHSSYKGFKVAKAHKINDAIKNEFSVGSAIGIYCYRNIKDVVVSFKNKNGFSINEVINSGFIESYIEDYFKWQHVEKLLISKYEDFAFDIRNEISRISSYLDIKLSQHEIDELSKKLEINNVKKRGSNIIEHRFSNGNSQSFDKDTLIHPNHIYSGESGQWKEELQIYEVQAIENVAFEWLYNHGYETGVILDALRLYSYSQCGEDDLVWRFSDKRNKGLIVEVGAFDGVHLSNSYILNNIGWKTICIEANPDSYKALCLNRPLSKNLHTAVVGSDYSSNTVSFLAEESGLYSGVSVEENDISFRYEKRNLEFKGFQKVEVPAKTLNQIFNEFKVKPNTIDCITIDVEGFEMSVLSGFDLEFYNPKILILEANSEPEKNNIESYLQGFGYQLGRVLGPNYVFVKQSDLKKLRSIKLDYIQMPQRHPKGSVFVVESLPNPKKELSKKKLKKVNWIQNLWKRLKSQ